MTKYVLLDPNQHKNIKILPHKNFKQSEHQHLTPLSVNEFAQASTSFPIVYMKDAEQGKFRAISMLGLLAGKNLFFTENEWLGTYVPSTFLRTPFDLGPDPKAEKTLTLYIDQDSDYLSQTEGEALFNENEPSQFLLSIQQNISAYYQSEMMTHQFTELLLKHDLLVEIELATQYESMEQNKIKGLYTINETSLNGLSQEVLFEFHQLNFLMPIYAMLASLTQINRLMTLHNKTQNRKITGIKMNINKGDEL
ncbi:SapC family protein [Colwellia sp. RE-S-Sl-9]